MSDPQAGPDGLVHLHSKHSFADTVERLRDAIAARGLKLFAVIDHSGEAMAASLSMPPTQVVLFGSPKGGTPLMLAIPSLAIDLPLRVLIAESADGAVTVSYTSPEFLVHRYGLAPEAMDVLGGAGKLATEAAS